MSVKSNAKIQMMMLNMDPEKDSYLRMWGMDGDQPTGGYSEQRYCSRRALNATIMDATSRNNHLVFELRGKEKTTVYFLIRSYEKTITFGSIHEVDDLVHIGYAVPHHHNGYCNFCSGRMPEDGYFYCNGVRGHYRCARCQDCKKPLFKRIYGYKEANRHNGRILCDSCYNYYKELERLERERRKN